MPIRLIHIRSQGELAAAAPSWDDLWRRSEICIPTVQADHLQLWLETFAPGAKFHALAVEQDGQLAAALPLVERKLGRVLRAGGMPSNDWTPSGELLLDPACDAEQVLDLLIGGLKRLRWPLLWLDAALIETPRWQALLKACARAGLYCDVQTRFRISKIEIAESWEAYRQTWSANHRRNMTRHKRQLSEQHGEVMLRVCAPQSSAEIASLLRRGFEIENRSWKGIAQSSVLKTPGRFEFFVRQAELLAARDQLEISFLDVADEPAAFFYQWKSKGVLHPFKCGFDESLRAFGVGQLLMHDVLERMFAHGDVYRTLDCMGPVSPMTQKWETGQYAVGRVVIAPRKLLGRAMLAVYQHVWPTLRRWRGKHAESGETGDFQATHESSRV